MGTRDEWKPVPGRTAMMESAVWSQRLGWPVFAVQPVAATRTATVVQLDGVPPDDKGRRSLIVKLSTEAAATFREQRYWMVLTQPLPLRAPHVVACGAAKDGSGAWIAFEDERLEEVLWTPARYAQALEWTARLHRMATWPSSLPPGVSHTPGAIEIAREVGAQSWQDRLALQRWCGASTLDVEGVRQLVTGVPWREDAQSRVVCHGDLHLGNFLWSPAETELYVIDWSFAHEDHAYFDLFQFIDATSPHAPLLRPVPRLQALIKYWRMWTDLQAVDSLRRPVASSPEGIDARTWMVGYLRFAALYLTWITDRIIDDVQHDRFPDSDLRRQAMETFAGLSSIVSDAAALPLDGLPLRDMP